MTTTTDTAQLERETEQTRAELEGTLDELRAKITPGQMVDQLMERAREGQAGEFVRNFGQQVAANPLPIAVMGIGLAWLMMANKNAGPRRSADDARYSDMYGERMVQEVPGGYQTRNRYSGEVYTGDGSGYRIGEDGSSRPMDESDTGYASDDGSDSGGRLAGMAEGASDMAHQAADRLGSSARDTRDRMSQVADRSRARLSDASSAVRDRLQHGAESAREGMHRAASVLSHSATQAGDVSRRFYDFCKEQPLVVAGLGLALGAALGAMLPATRMEDELVGDASDQVKRRASGMADRVKSEATSTWENTRDGLRDTMDRAMAGEGRDARSGEYRQRGNDEGYAAGASGGADLESGASGGTELEKEFETRKPQSDFGSTPTTQHRGAE